MHNTFFDFFDATTVSKKISTEFNERYRNFVLDVPYCSAYAFYKKYTGCAVEDNYGDNCIALSILARKLFCPEDAKYLYLISGRHRPLIFQDNITSNIIFIDPYLTHQYPILLNDLFIKPNQAIRYTIFPIGNENSMQLTFLPSLNIIRQEKFLSNGYIKFDYNLNEILTSDPDPYDENLLYHNEQDNLSIRVIHPSHEYTTHIICSLKSILKVKNRFRLPKLYTTSNGIIAQEGSEQFDTDLKIIEKIVQKSSSEIIAFFKKSIDAYIDNMPYDLTFEREKNYNPSNL